MKKNKDEELVSLNSELPQLYVEELEQRLETDPLMIGNVFDLYTSSDSGYCDDYSYCQQDGPCSEKAHCTGYY